jgi:hypothetical protein
VGAKEQDPLLVQNGLLPICRMNDGSPVGAASRRG